MNYDEFIIDMLRQSEELKIQAKFEESIKILNKVITEVPECFEAYEELGDNYLSVRETAKAEKALKQAIKINPKSSNAHYLLGFLFSLDQNWDDSVKELATADELLPNHPEILRCLGWSCYNQNRKSQKGVAILERSRNLCPGDPNILCDLGVCYMNSENYQQAIPLFEEVLAVAPNSEQAKECSVFLKILKSPDFES